MATMRSSQSRNVGASVQATAESRLTMTGMAAALLLLGWAVIAGATFFLDSSLSPRFLDLPLGAFLAGQGAVMGLVVVGMRVTRRGR